MTPESSRARILVVDDQVSIAKLLVTILGPFGYEIITVTSGKLALRKLEEQAVDLIMLDVLMPEMDGFKVCQRIRLQPELAEVPIIFLSAADDKTFIVRALEAGAVDYVVKPFNEAELVSRVRTHLALKQTRDRLKRLAEDKDELLGILAHDLKNHLGGMQMSAQLMHDHAAALADPRLNRVSSNILDASNQMFSFVREFLANAAADRGFQLNLEGVSLSTAAAAAVRRYAEAAKRKSISFHEDFRLDAPLVRADERALDQVIDNLVSNAVKFSPTGKSIWLSIAEVAGGQLELRVRDEGPGCDASDRARMFARYQRLSARPTAGEPSTGLGLSIAKRHVDAMNGTLHVESDAGLGATFVLRLPSTP
jgi:two-component system, sensor histidine kinase and response regulator